MTGKLVFEEYKERRDYGDLKETPFFKIFGTIFLLMIPVSMVALLVYTFTKNPLGSVPAVFIVGICSLIIILSATKSWSKFINFAEKKKLYNQEKTSGEELLGMSEMLKPQKPPQRIAAANRIEMDKDEIKMIYNGQHVLFSKTELKTGEFVLIQNRLRRAFDFYITTPYRGSLKTFAFCGIPIDEFEYVRDLSAVYPFSVFTGNAGDSLEKSVVKNVKREKKINENLKESYMGLIFGAVFVGISVLFMLLNGADRKGFLAVFAEIPPLIVLVMFFMLGLYLLIFSVAGLIYALVNIFRKR